MQRLAVLYAALAFALAGAACYLVATVLSEYIERSTVAEVRETVDAEGLNWITLRADGLNLHLSGPAPSEAARFDAVRIVQTKVNAWRLNDDITVVRSDLLHEPQFSLELLRNGDGISLIGLIPQSTGRNSILDAIAKLKDGARITDMLETADHPVPAGWDDAVSYALKSLRSLPRSKISVTPELVKITAISDSQDEKAAIEKTLNATRPDALTIELAISAPRPVITPFSLRLTIDAGNARFDSCSADTEQARSMILAASNKAGLDGDAECIIGLGTPTPRWGEAAELAIAALAELGNGDLTFNDADITIITTPDVEQDQFDEIIHNLETALPDVFSVHAVLPPKPAVEGQQTSTETREVTVTKSPEGLVQMRGRLKHATAKTSIHNYAAALFGRDDLYDTTRLDPLLPDDWSKRTLAGLHALSKLHQGILIIGEDEISLKGVSIRPEISTEVTQLLSDALGEGARFKIDIHYEEALDRVAQLPTPEECVDGVNDVLSTRQITFAPSSARIEDDSMSVMENIAKAMTDCSDVAMEIGGHTDSQGRETMNQTLSQARAEAVLDALLSLEILTTFLSAKGYGESVPIADNETEEGRQANRRIEFRLVKDPTGAARSSEEVDPANDEGAAEDDGESHDDGHNDDGHDDTPGDTDPPTEAQTEAETGDEESLIVEEPEDNATTPADETSATEEDNGQN